MTRRLLLASLLFLSTSGWAQPDIPVTVPVPSPIDISSNTQYRVPDICYPVLETVPDSWYQALGAAVARNRVALLTENYEALQLECRRITLVQELAKEGLDRQPDIEDGQYIPDWVNQEVETAQLLGVFARRRLHTLDSRDLETIKANVHYQNSPENRAEITMLTARTYLEQGQMRAFDQEMDKLRAYVESPAALKTLIIGYHCLNWHRTGRTSDLLDSVDKVIELGQSYKFGEWPVADVFWISVGDELVDLVRATVERYRQGGEDQTRLVRALQRLAGLNGQLARGVEGLDWFGFDYNILLDGLETYQGGIALLLAGEKVALYVYGIEERDRSDDKVQLSAYLSLLRDRHRQLNAGHWLTVPTSLYPTAPDMWKGSALERLEVRTRILLWQIEPNREVARELVSAVLRLSPQEEALALALDWADSLHKCDPRQAMAMLEQAEKLASEFGYPIYRLLIAEKQRLLLQGDGDGTRATRAAQRELDLARELVAVAVPLRDGRSVAEVARQASDYLATQSLTRGKPEAALAALEQGQALRSAEQLSAGASRSEGGAGQMLREIRQASTEQGVAARREALGETTLASGKGDFLKYSRDLQAQYPELYDRTLSVKPLEFPRLQKHLPKDALLLQYFPTDTTLYIFAMTGEELVLKSVELDKKTLDKELLGYLRTLRRVDQSAALTDGASNLYSWLLRPVDDLLASHETVLLVPTGRLNYLPFASLLDERGNPLAANHKMAFLGKSSDLLDVLAGQPEPVKGSLVVVADPAGDLPAARQEGEALASLFPDNLALYRDKATNEALTSGMKGHNLLHLATHGEIDPEDPGRNYLLMAGGERLTSEAIFSLPLESVRMVTLSACNTALGQSEPTASVVSLAESFWVTGPSSVVATLWAVNDASTAMFMKTFYGALRDGASKAQAMQIAQKALRESDAYTHPYFWSPFVLLGDWR